MFEDDFDLLFPMKRLRRQMGGMFSGFPETEFKGMKLKEFREPLIDIVDKGNEIEVIAELPGIDKKDLNIKVTEDSLILKAKSETKESKEGKGYYYRERGYSAFVRSVALPTEVIADKSMADFKNGVLTIRLRKKHPEEKEMKGFKIKIN